MLSLTKKIAAQAQRLEAAKALLAIGAVHKLEGTDQWAVESETEPGKLYLVNGSCSCPDFTYRAKQLDGLCKHRLVMLLALEEGAN